MSETNDRVQEPCKHTKLEYIEDEIEPGWYCQLCRNYWEPTDRRAPNGSRKLEEACRVVLEAHDAHERGESPFVPWEDLREALRSEQGKA